ncbi:MAG: helix-turn-helix domain-containing protein [Eubacteriales bacterium]|nr:helix-turn-helix domain-containing protein [Eubacteriales bacterium]
MVTYYKLFDLLLRRNMKKTDLLKVISSPTLAKLSNNEAITTKTIDKICLFLGVQPNSIMEIYSIRNGKRIKWDLEQNSGLFDRATDVKDLTYEEKQAIADKCLIKKENYYLIDTDKYLKEVAKEMEKL